MARIAGINIPMNKHVVIGLTHIFGVGRSRAKDICASTGIAPTTKVKDLTEIEVNAIRSASVTARACRSVASARAPTRARARVRARALLPKRRPFRTGRN